MKRSRAQDVGAIWGSGVMGYCPPVAYPYPVAQAFLLQRAKHDERCYAGAHFGAFVSMSKRVR
jgi:hypothetical protein